MNKSIKKIMILLSVILVAFGYIGMPQAYADFVFKMGAYWTVINLLFLVIMLQVIKTSFVCRDREGNEPRWKKAFVILQSFIGFVGICVGAAGTILLIGKHAPGGEEGAMWAVLATMVWTTMVPFLLAEWFYAKWLTTFAKLVAPYYAAFAVGLGSMVGIRGISLLDKNLCVFLGAGLFFTIALVATAVIMRRDLKSLPGKLARQPV